MRWADFKKPALFIVALRRLQERPDLGRERHDPPMCVAYKDKAGEAGTTADTTHKNTNATASSGCGQTPNASTAPVQSRTTSHSTPARTCTSETHAHPHRLTPPPPAQPRWPHPIAWLPPAPLNAWGAPSPELHRNGMVPSRANPDCYVWPICGGVGLRLGMLSCGCGSVGSGAPHNLTVPPAGAGKRYLRRPCGGMG